MLSLKRCRELLGFKCALTDYELGVLRDQLYGLAQVLVEAVLDRRRGEGCSGAAEAVPVDGVGENGSAPSIKSLQDMLTQLPPDQREHLEERAAIREFDGSLGRDEAERAAIFEYWRSMGN